MLTWNETLTANAAVTNSVVVSQSIGGAGNLTKTASTVTFGGGVAQLVTISGGSNESGKTFTIIGTDPDGNPQTFSMAGPSNNTVTTTVPFATITTVSVSAATAGTVTVGNSATAVSSMFVPNIDSNPFEIGMGCVILNGTTPTYSIQHTFINPMAKGFVYSNAIWFNHSVINDKTTNQDGNYDFPVFGIRLVLTVAGTVQVNLLQSGGGYR